MEGSKSPPLPGEEGLFVLNSSPPRWMERWWNICSCTIFMYGFVGNGSRLLAWWLRLHAMNFVISHNCPPWTHRRYMFSTWKRRATWLQEKTLAVITGDFWVKSGILDCKWLWSVMPLGWGACAWMALGGGALEVDLDSAGVILGTMNALGRIRCDRSSWLLWKLP